LIAIFIFHKHSDSAWFPVGALRQQQYLFPFLFQAIQQKLADIFIFIATAFPTASAVFKKSAAAKSRGPCRSFFASSPFF
jgi:hypothetical protein